VVNVEPALEDSTTNQHWVQMVMGNERVMLLTFEITMANATGTMSIFIPFSTLKPIGNVLNPHIWIAGRKEQQPDPIAREATLKNISQVVLPFKVILGEVNLSLREISELEIGDVVRLDSSVFDDLVIMLANRKRLTGKVGRVGKRMGVQITGALPELLFDQTDE
jgi:flagellar motor switch protein FliM